MMKVLLVANTDWYLYNFRLLLARSLRDDGHEVVCVSPDGDYVEKIKAEGFRWLPLHITRRGMNPIRELRAVIQLLGIYRHERPDVVNHFTIKPVLYGSLAAKFARVGRVINSITGLGHVFITKRRGADLLRAFTLLFYRVALVNTRVIFQNQNDLEQFTKTGILSTQQCTLIPGSGVDTKRFIYLPFPAQQQPMVLFVGRLLWSKGIGEFVEAAQALRKAGCTARFIAAGDRDDGNPDSLSKEQVEGWASEGAVEFPGWVNDITPFLRSAWVVCLPSYREGLSRVLLEAAACGRTIVTSDVPGCREVVRAGKSGFLVPVMDSEALARAIQLSIASAETCEQMGLAGREWVEENFSAASIIKATKAVYFC